MILNLTEQEVNQLLAFLNTCQITGRDAFTLAVLQQKITQQLQASREVIEKVAEDIKKEEPKKEEK